MRTATIRSVSRSGLRVLGSAALATLLASAFGARTAYASADTFGVGDAHRGSVTVGAADTQVNSYASLAVDADVNATVLAIGAVNGAAFAPGDLVVIWRSTGLSPAPASGSQTAIDLSGSAVGRWELARVASIGAGSLTLTSGTLNAYASGLSQVVRVPEYDVLTIDAGASIVALPWTGLIGGVTAFFANTVTNNGRISADFAGYRGGARVNHGDLLGCVGNDGLSSVGYSAKGEGLVPASFGALVGGRGNVASGAGGGNCMNSGGGGGGNGSLGGAGGRSYSNYGAGQSFDDGARDVGGLGGAALTYSLLDHFTFGGGGGAGDENSNSGSSGGRGGGVVFVRAGTLSGATGVIAARGETPDQATVAGAGGGGAGGSILVRVYTTAACAEMTATGGNGGSNAVNGYGPHGPGGAGGGGRVLLQAAGGTCTPSSGSGLAGTQDSPFPNPYGASYGATPPTSATAGAVEPPPTGGYCATDAQCSGATPFCATNGSCGSADGGVSDAGADGSLTDGAKDDGSLGGDGAASDGAATDAAANDGAATDGAANDGAAGGQPTMGAPTMGAHATGPPTMAAPTMRAHATAPPTTVAPTMRAPATARPRKADPRCSMVALWMLPSPTPRSVQTAAPSQLRPPAARTPAASPTARTEFRAEAARAPLARHTKTRARLACSASR